MKEMKNRNAAGDNGITVDILKQGGYIVLAKIAVRFSLCLKTRKLRTVPKNAVIILIYQKGNPKDLKQHTRDPAPVAEKLSTILQL